LFSREAPQISACQLANSSPREKELSVLCKQTHNSRILAVGRGAGKDDVKGIVEELYKACEKAEYYVQKGGIERTIHIEQI
jgi:hypothetical protein